MNTIQLELPQDPEFRSRRTQGIFVSLVIHFLLVAMIIANPEFLRTTPRRIIRIAGQDYDLDRMQLRELVVPPKAERPPEIAKNEPLIEPNLPRVQPPPPPPSEPVIGPDDVIAEGARPDAPPKPSSGERGEELASKGAESTLEPKRPKEGRETVAENTNPNALRLPNLMASAGRIVDEAVQESLRRQRGRSAGTEQGIQEHPNFSTEEPTILSDTKGYDFGPYLNQVVNRVRVNWYSLIPEVARLGRKGRVVIVFMIVRSGLINELQLVANSGAEPLDRAAVAAIQASNPFPPLPSNFEGDHIVLQFTFLYNLSR